jgi:hypothetical protein
VPNTFAFVGAAQTSGPSGPSGPPQYSRSALYNIDDIVSYLGQIYKLRINTFTPPPNNQFELVRNIGAGIVDGYPESWQVNQIGYQLVANINGVIATWAVFYKCIQAYSTRFVNPPNLLYPTGNIYFEVIEPPIKLVDVPRWNFGLTFAPDTFIQNGYDSNLYRAKAVTASIQPYPTDSPVWLNIGYDPSYIQDPLSVLRGPILFQSFDPYEAIYNSTGEYAFYAQSAGLKLTECYQMATNGSALVAVGSHPGGDYLWHSLDFGETWEVCTIINPDFTRVEQILNVPVPPSGLSGPIISREETTVLSTTLSTVACIGSVFVAAGNGSFYSSTNGISWIILSSIPGNIISLAAHSSNFIAFTENQIYLSSKIIQPSIHYSQSYIQSQTQFRITFSLVYTFPDDLTVVPNLQCFVVDTIQNPCNAWKQEEYKEDFSLGVLVNQNLNGVMRARLLRSQSIRGVQGSSSLDPWSFFTFDPANAQAKALSVFYNYRNIFVITESGIQIWNDDITNGPLSISGPFIEPRTLWNGTHFFILTNTRLIRYSYNGNSFSFNEIANMDNPISLLWCPVMPESLSFADTITKIISR